MRDTAELCGPKQVRKSIYLIVFIALMVLLPGSHFFWQLAIRP